MQVRGEPTSTKKGLLMMGRLRQVMAAAIALAAVLMLAGVSGTASAATARSVNDVAAALRSDPLYVDDTANGFLHWTPEQTKRLDSQLRASSPNPVFFAAAPASLAPSGSGTPESRLAAGVARANAQPGVFVVFATQVNKLTVYRQGVSLTDGQLQSLYGAAKSAHPNDIYGTVLDFASKVQSVQPPRTATPPRQTNPTITRTQPAQSSSHTGLWVVLGIVGAALLALVIFLVMRAKKRKRRFNNRKSRLQDAFSEANAEITELNPKTDDDYTQYSKLSTKVSSTETRLKRARTEEDLDAIAGDIKSLNESIDAYRNRKKPAPAASSGSRTSSGASSTSHASSSHSEGGSNMTLPPRTRKPRPVPASQRPQPTQVVTNTVNNYQVGGVNPYGPGVYGPGFYPGTGFAMYPELGGWGYFSFYGGFVPMTLTDMLLADLIIDSYYDGYWGHHDAVVINEGDTIINNYDGADDPQGEFSDEQTYDESETGADNYDEGTADESGEVVDDQDAYTEDETGSDDADPAEVDTAVDDGYDQQGDEPEGESSDQQGAYEEPDQGGYGQPDDSPQEQPYYEPERQPEPQQQDFGGGGFDGGGFDGGGFDSSYDG